MTHNPQHFALGTMTAEAFSTPMTIAACEIDFSDDTPSQKIRSVCRNDLADELMARRSLKSVITALQLEVRIANSCAQQTDQSKSIAAFRFSDIANSHAMVFKVNSQHGGTRGAA